MKFKDKLRKARKAAHMTQEELAEAVGVTTNTISNYELGRTYPYDHALYEKIASVLHVETHYLHNEEDTPGTDSPKAYDLINDITCLFAGGEVSDADMDAVMKAMTEAYWKCKAEKAAKEKKN